MPIGAFKLNNISRYLAPTGRTAKSISVYSSAQISTAQSKFGGSSIAFNGSSDYMVTSASDDFNPGSSDWTWEFWAYTTTVDNVRARVPMGGRIDFEPLFYMSSATLRLYLSKTGTAWDLVSGVTVATMSVNTWTHIAVVRNGTTIKTYKDGVQTSSTTVGASDVVWWTTNQIFFGDLDPQYSVAWWSGYLDEIRVSNIARYTTAFTPSSTEFTNDANTLLLIHGNGTNGSTSIVDDNNGGPAAPSPVSSVSIQSNTTSTSSTITIPATAAKGDIAFLFDTSTTVTNASITGWTIVSQQTTTGIRTNVSYKVLSSSDAGTTITGLGGTTRKVLLIYRGNTLVTNPLVDSLNQQSTTSAPTNQSLVGTSGPMIAFAVYASTGSIATRGWSAGSPTEYSNFSTSGLYVKGLITNSGTPSTTTISMSDGGTNTLQSFRIKIS